MVGLVCFLAGSALLVAGLILSRKGKLDKWLKVQWAVPGVENHTGEAVAETASVRGSGESSEAGNTADGPVSAPQAELTDRCPSVRRCSFAPCGKRCSFPSLPIRPFLFECEYSHKKRYMQSETTKLRNSKDF